ncbi:hypothetical protein PGB90_006834 [Kerria lacca]
MRRHSRPVTNGRHYFSKHSRYHKCTFTLYEQLWQMSNIRISLRNIEKRSQNVLNIQK